MAQDAAPGALTEAEMQEMLAQMREAPAEQVLVEVINALLQASQVKLGRPDARLLIDAVAAMADAVQGRADASLLDQVGQAVTQLRLAQVEAEGGDGSAQVDGSAQADGGDEGAPPPPADGPSATPADAPPAAGGQPSRLWVPGR